MSRVLVTGSAGRLGRSVVTVLEQHEHEVIGVDSALPRDGSAGLSVDLTNGEACVELMMSTRPDAVIHLAAIAVPFSAPEDHILRTNVALAYNTLSAAADAGVHTIITASSPTVFGYGAPSGWRPQALPLTEDMAARPWNAYALSKLVAEQVAAMLAAKHGDSVRFASFRPCYVIAPEEWSGALTQQGHTVADRLALPELSAPALFNYVDARDVGEFLVRLLERAEAIPNAQTFMVGAADALARQPLAELFPRYLPELADFASELTGTTPAFSIAKAEKLLDWRPRYSWRTELACASEHASLDELLSPPTSIGGQR